MPRADHIIWKNKQSEKSSWVDARLNSSVRGQLEGGGILGENRPKSAHGLEGSDKNQVGPGIRTRFLTPTEELLRRSRSTIAALDSNWYRKMGQARGRFPEPKGYEGMKGHQEEDGTRTRRDARG